MDFLNLLKKTLDDVKEANFAEAGIGFAELARFCRRIDNSGVAPPTETVFYCIVHGAVWEVDLPTIQTILRRIAKGRGFQMEGRLLTREAFFLDTMTQSEARAGLLDLPEES